MVPARFEAQFEERSYPVPTAAPGEVLVRLRAGGVCDGG